MNVPVISQLDPRWSGKPLGNSGLTVGQDGCLLSDCFMALKVMGYQDLDFIAFIDSLNAHMGFNNNGELLHEAIPQVYPHTFWWDEPDTTNDAHAIRIGELGILQPSEALFRIKRLVARGIPVPVEIQLAPGSPHWLLTVDFTDTDLIVNDPAHGDQIRFSTRYGDPLKAITSYLALIGQPTQADTKDLLIEGQMLSQLVEAVNFIPAVNPARNIVKNAITLLIS